LAKADLLISAKTLENHYRYAMIVSLMNSELINLIERISNLLRAESRNLDLQPIQFQILQYLHRANRYSNTASALADFLNITKGTISQSIKSLINKNYIKQIADAKDSRLLHLQLTTKGTKHIQKRSEKISALIKNALSCELEAASVVSLRLLLKEIQLSNNNQIFGVCKTCRFFIRNKQSQKHQCGLTKEILLEHESELLCREHAA
jgi:DNA-binding MarR family transcriptional regulator